MSMLNSSYTGRAPRTLQGAFGPYATWHVEKPRSFADKYLIGIALVLFVATIGVSLFVQLW